MIYPLSLKFLQKYIKDNKINYDGKLENFPLSYEELIKVFYQTIDFKKSFCLYHSGGIAGGEYPVLIVYLTKNNKWIFQFNEELEGNIKKQLFVSYKKFPYWELKTKNINQLLLNKTAIEFYFPISFDFEDDKMPFKHFVIDSISIKKEEDLKYAPILSFMETPLDSDLNWALDYFDKEEVLKALENHKIPSK